MHADATWPTMLNNRKKVGVYCSDVSGAFDRVCAARLLQKLAALGLHRDLFGTVQSWLRDRQAFVVVAGDCSAGSVLSNMVYQGTVWGPTLWNAFIGDASMGSVSAGYCIVIYADDLNAFTYYSRSLFNHAMEHDLRECQRATHRWREGGSKLWYFRRS